MSSGGWFLEGGDRFRVDDMLCLRCGTLVLVMEVFSDYLVLSDEKGNSRKIKVTEIYKQEKVWPWVERATKKRGTGKFYVYFVEHEGAIIYIGKGCDDRYKHVNSGTSSSYMLNKMHFNGDKLDVYIFANNLSQSYATAIEAHQIRVNTPRCNKMIPAERFFDPAHD